MASESTHQEVARNLGVSVSTLYRWLPAGGVLPENRREAASRVRQDPLPIHHAG